jgi:hypothetical protein
MNKLALSTVVAGLVVLTSSASAQVCNGTAPFSAGKLQAGFGIRMPNAGTIFDGEFASGMASGLYAGATMSILSADGGGSSTTFGGFLGKTMAIDAKKTVEMCPEAFLMIGENSTNSFGGGVSFGRNFQQSSFDLVPFAGASLHRDDFGSTSDFNLGIVLGTGFVLGKVWTVRPYLNVPLTNNGDSVLGIMGHLNFGGTP